VQLIFLQKVDVINMYTVAELGIETRGVEHIRYKKIKARKEVYRTKEMVQFHYSYNRAIKNMKIRINDSETTNMDS
jgi:hypothetical protein